MTEDGRGFSWRIAVAVAIGLAFVLSVVVFRGRSADASVEIRHVLLISLDTCRADHLGCYGCALDTTPHIDALAEEGYLFEKTISPVPMTLPSHCSMLTGTIPPYHGVHDNLDNRLSASNVTLAELLQARGFVTGAVVSSFVLDSKFGLDQGFDVYDDRFKKAHVVADLAERRGDEATEQAIAWYNEHQADKSFLFLHYYDPHTTYDPPEPFASRFPDRPYAGEVAFTDHCVGRVLEHLKKLGLYDSTLILVTGDHGEMLGEHGELTHSFFVYRSAIEVPLVLRIPGQAAGQRIGELAGLVDIVPTVCALLGIEPPSGIRGRDLSPLWERGARWDEERFIYCESLTPTKYDGNSLLAMAGSQLKYIQTTRPELYDLDADPGETRNFVKDDPGQAAFMRALLEEALQAQYREARADGEISLGDEDRRRLESLGYIATARVNTDFSFDRSKMDPKDLVAVHEMDARVGGLIVNNRLDTARDLCEQMLARQPKLGRAHHHMARISMEQNDLETAAKHLRIAIELDDQDAPAHSTLGAVLVMQEKADEALGCFRRALEIKPGFVEARFNLANVLKKKERLREAIDEFREVIRQDPDLAKAHGKLGVALRMQGATEEAIAALARAVELDPDSAEAHHNLGIALESQGEIDEALVHFRRVVEIDSSYADAHNNLGTIMASKGRLAESVNHFRRAVQANPQYGDAHYHLGMALAMTGRSAEALQSFERAAALQPDRLEPLNAAAWILATHSDSGIRSSSKAVEFAERAREVAGPRHPGVLDTLAAAYASAGRFDEAVAQASSALDLAIDSGQAGLAEEIKIHLDHYRQGKPYVEP